MKWISVKERLPKGNQEVLCCDYEDFLFLCVFLNCEFYRLDFSHKLQQMQVEERDKVKHITHWMPLPQPAKGDE